MLHHFCFPPSPPTSPLKLQKALKHQSTEGRILMGNYRFRLSDMMPDSWFYKLKEMGSRRRNHSLLQATKKKELASASTTQKTPKTEQILLNSRPRKSHYFTRELVSGQEPGNSPADNTKLLPDPPRKSSKQKPRRRPTTRSSPRLVASSVPAGCSCGTALETVCSKTDCPPNQLLSPPADILVERESHQSEFRSDPVLLSQSFDGVVCGCHAHTHPDANTIIVEKEEKTISKKFNDPGELKSLAEIELPPIITRSSRSEETHANRSISQSPSVTITKKEKSSAKEQRNSPFRKFTVNSPGAKLRINSPRVSSKRFNQVHRRKSVASSSKRSLTDSLAIVKSSNDPQRDFRESMEEMIVENKISASNELEDLLACYLSLNTDEYHDLIIKVFKQIWFDMTDIGI